MIAIDLHTHSYFSDGDLSPTELIEKAHSLSITHLALTDHDSISGIEEARIASKKYNIQLINGVEISVMWDYKSQFSQKIKSFGIHVIGLNFKDKEYMNQQLIEVQHARGRRAIQISNKLAEKIGKNPLEELLVTVDNDPDRLTRSHFAKWLKTNGFVNHIQQAFDRYLGEGKCAYLPLEQLSLQQGIDLIHQAGGIAVLAHPIHYPLSATQLRLLIAEFHQLGGEGIELPKVTDASGTRDMLYREIKKYNLLVSQASDFHGESMSWRKLGQVPMVPEGMTSLFERFEEIYE